MKMLAATKPFKSLRSVVKRTLIQQAIATLTKLTRSPASIFVPGSGYLQTPANLLTWSNDLSNAAWVAEFTASKSGSNILTPAVGDTVYHGTTVAAGSYTLAAQLSGSGTCTLFAYNATDHIHGETQVTLTSTPTIFAANITSTNANTFYYIGRRTGDTATSITFGGAGLFAGTYTAAQLAAMGGIPWTMGTTSVSLSLGPELNGDIGFDTPAYWTTNGQSPIPVVSGGVCSVSGAAIGNRWVQRANIATVSKTYKVEFDATVVSGAVSPDMDGSSHSITATGRSSNIIVASTTTLSVLFNSSFVGSIDNLSCREVISTPCPVYTDAHVYLPGSAQVSYGPELITTPTGYINQTKCSLAIVGDEVELTATATGVCFVDVPSAAVVVGSTYQVYVMARYSGSAGGVVYLGAAMSSVPYSSSTTSATSVPLSLTPVADHTQIWLRMRLDATAIGQKAYFKLGSVREVITTSSVTAGLPTNNYTLSNGSTGYSAIDGTAGLVLDAAGSVGAELFTGAFTRYNTVESDTTTVPALCTSTGVFSVVGISKSATANMPYRCSVAWSGNTTGRTIQVGGGTGIATLGTAVSGSATFTVVPSNVSMYIYFTASAAGQAVSFDSFSAKPISGIHAAQATTANKPALRRGLLNQILQSRNYATTWTVVATGATVATDVAVAPDGTTTADALVEVTGTTYGFQQTTAITGPATFAVLVKAGAKSQVYLQPNAGGSYFNLATGAVGALGAGCTASSIAPVANGYYLCVINYASTNTPMQIYAAQAGAIGYTGTAGVQALYLSDAGLFAGTLTAAQILAEGGIPLTTSTAASNPSAGRYSWQFDGTNDSLVIGNIGFTTAATIVVAGRVDSLSGTNMILREDANGVQFFVNSLGAIYFDKAGVATLVASSAGTITPSVPFVITARLSDGVAVIRKNGVQIATAANLSVFEATTGARIGMKFDGVQQPFVGTLSSVIALPCALTDADLLTLERWVASLTPNAPTF